MVAPIVARWVSTVIRTVSLVTALTVLCIHGGAAGQAAAPTVPDYEGEFFTDLTHSVHARQRVDISRKLRVAAEMSRIHPMLVLLSRMDQYPAMPQSIDGFATQLAQQWRIGDQQTKQGVLVLFSILDRKFYVARTSNLDQRLSDTIVQRIRASRVPDALKAEDLGRAMILAADVIAEQLAATGPAGTSRRGAFPVRTIDRHRGRGGLSNIGGLICPAIIVLMIISSIVSMIGGRRHGYGPGYGGPGYGGGGYGGGGFGGTGSFLGGMAAGGLLGYLFGGGGHSLFGGHHGGFGGHGDVSGGDSGFSGFDGGFDSFGGGDFDGGGSFGDW